MGRILFCLVVLLPFLVFAQGGGIINTLLNWSSGAPIVAPSVFLPCFYPLKRCYVNFYNCIDQIKEPQTASIDKQKILDWAGSPDFSIRRIAILLEKYRHSEFLIDKTGRFEKENEFRRAALKCLAAVNRCLPKRI